MLFRDAIRKPQKCPHPMDAARLRRIVRIEFQWRPQQLGSIEYIEIRRHHTHDRVGKPIELHRPAEDIRVGIEAGAPQTIAQQRDRSAVWAILVGCEIPAQHRLYSEDGQHLVRQIPAQHPFRGAVVGQVIRRGRKRCHLARHASLSLPFHKIWCGKSVRAAIGIDLPHRHHAIGLMQRQRLQKHCVDHAKHRGIRPDRQRDREHSDNGEAGRAQQGATSEFDVLQQPVHAITSSHELRYARAASQVVLQLCKLFVETTRVDFMKQGSWKPDRVGAGTGSIETTLPVSYPIAAESTASSA